jgi:hypothetical protein
MVRDIRHGASPSAALAVGQTTNTTLPGTSVTRHLTQADLACRWRVSERTLEGRRWRKLGPPYLKISHRVVYRLADILAYEAAQLRLPNPTAADPFFRKVR